jgi:hypothetical protein
MSHARYVISAQCQLARAPRFVISAASNTDVQHVACQSAQCHTMAHAARHLASSQCHVIWPQIMGNVTEYIFYCNRAILFLSSSKILTPHPPPRPASVYPPPLLRGEDQGGWARADFSLAWLEAA